jgi:hypothetical protein
MPGVRCARRIHDVAGGERSAQPAGRKADAPALGRASRGGLSEGFWNRAFAPKPALPSARADPEKSAL